MLYCFKNFVMMYLLFLLLMMKLKDVQLTIIFVNDIKHFSLTFKINFDFDVNRMNALFRILITKVLKSAFALLWMLIQFWEFILLWIKWKLLRTILNYDESDADIKIKKCVQTLKFKILQWIHLMLYIICIYIIFFW